MNWHGREIWRSLGHARIALMIAFSFQGCQKERREVYELPPGLRGWVHVDVDMPNCPPLEVRDGVAYIHVGSDGRGCISGTPPAGQTQETYVYLDPDRTQLKQTGWGGGGMVWAGHSIILLQREGKRYLCSYGFFVGTEQDYKRSGGDAPSNERCSPREFDPARTPF
jgi:hypothetical protein